MEETVEGLRNAISEMTQQVDALEAEVEEANGAVVQKDRQMQTRETQWQTMLDGLDASRTGLEAQFTARTLEQNLNIRDLRSELEKTKDQLAAEKKLTAQLKKRKCTTKHDAELSTKPANCDQNDTCAYISTDLTGSVPAQNPSNRSRALGFSDLNLSPRANGATLSTWPSSPSPLAVTHKDKGSPVIVATAPSDHDLFNATLTVPPQVQATITPRQLACLGLKTLTSESEEQCVSPLEEAGPILDSIQSPSCPIDLALPKIVDWSLPQGSSTSHGGSANSSRRHSAVSTFSTSAFQLDMAVPLSSIKTETLEEPLSPSACLWIACPSELEPRPSTSPRDIADLFSPLLNGSDSSASVPPLFATLDVPLASPSNVVRDETNVLPSPTSNRVTGGGDVPPAEIIIDSVVGLPPWVQFEQRIDARCRTSTPAGRSPSEPSCPLPTPTKTQTSTRTPLGALDNTARDNDGRVSRAGFR
ncbi:hypothetical protein OF83DRAFT_655911 [Amylostereum chailletii]|nr:hypothetical protein OF83DRAFT_655911 [Amylostereum chailletii]